MYNIDLKPELLLRAIWPVAVVALLAAGLYVFIELADGVMEGETLALDQSLLLALREDGDPGNPLGPPWLEETAAELTALGGYPIIVLLTLAVAGYLSIVAWRGAAYYVIGSVAGGASISAILKESFGRARPELVEALDVTHTASFPSGHAMVGTVVYLTLAALLVRYARTHAERIYVVCVAGFIAVIVGLSRVYLGVHWPSDVLAGWALGLSWAAFVWCVVATIEYRRQIRRVGVKAGRFLWRREKDS